MDYSYYTAAQQQPYQFLGLPPTPTHTNTNSASDEYSNSPPDDFNQFRNYEYPQYPQNGISQHKHPTPQHKPSISAANGFDVPRHGDETQRGSNSDEDERDMTPAQSRRKAQNRAAQRAFRERKERHVKDLEAKLAALEKNSLSISEENERLKLQLQKTATENEILKATSAMPRGPSALPNTAPLQYKPVDFYSELLQSHDNKTPSHRIVMSENGERLFAAGAVWDYIVKHPLYIKGFVDMALVTEILKKSAKCDGQGPVFEESAILDAIEQSVASGSDELI